MEEIKAILNQWDEGGLTEAEALAKISLLAVKGLATITETYEEVFSYEKWNGFVDGN